MFFLHEGLLYFQVPEAMQVMHDRRNVGKLVLDPAMEPRPRPATPAKEKSKKEDSKSKKNKGGDEKKEEKGAGDAPEEKKESEDEKKDDDIKPIDESDTPSE
jgi:hypothetical protein